MNAPNPRAMLIATAVGLVALLGIVLLVRDCQRPDPTVVVISNGIDAGPGEAAIAARLDAEIQEAEQRMVRIEQKFDADLAAFDAQQRAQYRQLREGEDLEAAARFLTEWSRTRRRDGP